jgi:hypothetical protein
MPNQHNNFTNESQIGAIEMSKGKKEKKEICDLRILILDSKARITDSRL